MSDTALSFHTAHMNRCIDGLRAGDPAAVNELVRRAQGRFHRLARRMYRSFPNVRPVAESDDVEQVGWVRLLRTLQRLRPDNTGKFFLLAGVMIRRELLDLARKARGQAYQFRSLDALTTEDGTAGANAVPEPAARATAEFELWELFHEAVGRVSADPQKVMILIFYDGRTRAEVADILGCDIRTVGRWWKQACMEVRALVGGAAPLPH
ncbi:MAG: sigma-70 family RNA polymerase sigma factor [Gemmataceae bacterium]